MLSLSWATGGKYVSMPHGNANVFSIGGWIVLGLFGVLALYGIYVYFDSIVAFMTKKDPPVPLLKKKNKKKK